MRVDYLTVAAYCITPDAGTSELNGLITTQPWIGVRINFVHSATAREPGMLPKTGTVRAGPPVRQRVSPPGLARPAAAWRASPGPTTV